MTLESLSPLQSEIESIFVDYIRIQSYTNTPDEKRVEPFLSEWFSSQDYFSNHPEMWGLYPLEQDILKRHVVWGMVKGQGDDTIVMIHHSDVVEIEDFELAKPFAHDIKQINHHIRAMIHKFDPEAMEDLDSGLWQFGRGTADMKAGGAIQLALLKHYSRQPDFRGNLIVLCLPDEENLSAGMRSALSLLGELKHQHNLNYRLMINSEPHQSTDPDHGVVYEGSVGKLMPVVYARGSLAHVGRIFEGLNPVHLMSELVTATELNMAFSDTMDGEAAPPPSWLYLKDTKTHYDVSIPTAIRAYMSILTLTSSPEHLVQKLKTAAERAFDTVLTRMNQSFSAYLEATGQDAGTLPWKRHVKTFAELFSTVADAEGPGFINAYQAYLEQINQSLAGGAITLAHASFALIEFCLDHYKNKLPIMIIGLSPPYYPDVNNQRIGTKNPVVKDLVPAIQRFTLDTLGQAYISRQFYTGISDLSYTWLHPDVDLSGSVAANMPLWGSAYQINFQRIKDICMPCINIGPWGKDFHKLTERVLIRDLYERTPLIIDFTIRQILNNHQTL